MVAVKWLEGRIKVTRRLINTAELKIRLQGIREQFVEHRKALL